MSSILKPKALAINLFKNKPELMLRKMLAAPKRSWTGPELAKEVGVQRIWASRVLTTLEFEKFAEREGTGAHSKYRLKNVDKLLQRWKLSYHIDFNEHHPYRFVGKNPLKLIANESKKGGFRYAVTGVSAIKLAKNRPHEGPYFVYVWPNNGVESDFYKILDDLEAEFDLIPTEKKPDLILMKPHSMEGVFEDIIIKSKVCTVSCLQAELDEPS